MSKLEVGLVIEVWGSKAKIATFDNMNHDKLIFEGELINNIKVNSFIVINQGFTKIIGRIYSETIWDTQHSHQEYNLDSRFSKKSIRRVLEVETIGYIEKNVFFSGVTYFPMVGNRCSIPSQQDINCIYINNYLQDNNSKFVKIGLSLNERAEIKLPLNQFFASHIGIFGNTGSGKSNTLHKLYYELFKNNNSVNMKQESSFIVLDLNGEYVGEHSFGVNSQWKRIFRVGESEDEKIIVNQNTFFDIEMLTILLDAKIATQVPFLKRILEGIETHSLGPVSLSRYIVYIIKQVFSILPPNTVAKNELIQVLEDYYAGMNHLLTEYRNIEIHSVGGKFQHNTIGFFNGIFENKHYQILKINEIKTFVENNPLNPLVEFEVRAKLYFIRDLLYNRIQYDHVSPLINRITTNLSAFENYIKISEETDDTFLKIYSLRNLDNKDKQFVSMLITKKAFDEQKQNIKMSTHLIIDEAHNILSGKIANEVDTWKDYRLDLFEQIIKEGRKFGFFLTLSSQRPADISPTILSQVHNFFIHKLVNERDLQIIENSISSLDSVGKAKLPTLPKGVCIISGDALSMPITVVVDFNENSQNRPDSDTVNLEKAWE